MAWYESSVIEALQQRADLVEINSGFVPLKRVGSRFLGVCPFHNDKSPSMNVNPAMGIYKCFACGAHGNVFTFLMEHEKMDFVSALHYVAEKSHFQLPEPTSTPEIQQKKAQFKDLASLNKIALDFFVKNLQKTPEVKIYLDKRGLKSHTLEEFGIGWAPSEWDSLTIHCLGMGFSEKELIDAGLVSTKDSGGIFDKFRARVMIPIHSLSQQVIAFGGRTLDPTNPAKYMNSPETALYHKSSVLYGLSHSKTEISKQKSVIFVEGYLDFLQLWQGDIKNVVAVSGTALTNDHAKILARYAKKAYLVFDGDEAGFKAAERSLPILLQQGFEVRILLLPEGEDPDTIVKNSGKSAFMERLEHSRDFIQFLAQRCNASIHATPEIKADFGQKIQALIAFLPDQITRAAYAQRAAQTIGVSEKIFLQHIVKTATQAPQILQNTEKLLNYETRLFELLLGQEILRKISYQYLSVEQLKSPAAQEILDHIYALVEENQFNTNKLYENLSPNLQSIMAQWEVCTSDDPLNTQEFGQIMSRIKLDFCKEQVKIAQKNGQFEDLFFHKKRVQYYESIWTQFGQDANLDDLFEQLFAEPL
jgi:DNA primase catalytic core